MLRRNNQLIAAGKFFKSGYSVRVDGVLEKPDEILQLPIIADKVRNKSGQRSRIQLRKNCSFCIKRKIGRRITYSTPKTIRYRPNL